ncbi:MAG: hypothetical protein Crog4KO_28710 [Crocinitomicaceae bacterium]
MRVILKVAQAQINIYETLQYTPRHTDFVNGKCTKHRNGRLQAKYTSQNPISAVKHSKL